MNDNLTIQQAHSTARWIGRYCPNHYGVEVVQTYHDGWPSEVIVRYLTPAGMKRSLLTLSDFIEFREAHAKD